jgi:hypothetical protein
MFQAAPIGAHHFLAANHVGGNVGDTFLYQGASYTTVKSYIDSSSDLRIWEVREAFPTWAPLFRNSNESGTMVVIGRGIPRGGEVRTAVATSNTPANSLAGWYWGNYDGVLRWGTNTVSTFTTSPSFGPQIVAAFDKAGGSNECHLGIYDSSSPVFIKSGTAWKLAGIAGLVDGGFSLTSGGSTFNAFIFDKRGLFNGTTQYTGLIAEPSSFYATRVSSRISWIDGILAQPLTCTVVLGNLNQTYSGSPCPVIVTTTPAIPVSVTYNGSTTIPVNAGTYAVVATASGSNNGYNYAGSASGSLVVAKAGQTVSFNLIAEATVGDQPQALAATATSGLPVSYASSNPAVASIAGNILTVVAPGTVTITAMQGGNGNFNAATDVARSLTVTAAANGDVPLLPAWAMAGLVAVLIAAGARFLPRVHSRTTH